MRPRVARHTNVIDLPWRDAAHPQAGTNRLGGKSGHVLDAPVPFLFDGGDQFAVADEHCRDVTVVRVDAENVQWESSVQPDGYRRIGR
jgi:hypothetical protein